MSLPTKTKRQCKVEFTVNELQDFASQLAANITERNQLENDKKEVMSGFKARIDEKTSRIQRLAENIQSGYEYREVSCSIQYDFNRRVKTIARLDTGEIIVEEVITAEESQMDIPGLEPELEAEMRKNLTERYGKDITQEDDGLEYWLNRDYYQTAMVEYAETADEGRNILSAYEDRLNQLQRAAGVTPVCGRIDERTYSGFSTLEKKEINAICKAVSKADPGVGMIHTAIVEQWPAMQKRWDELLEAEHEETEN